MRKIEIAVERVSPTLALLRIGSAVWPLRIVPDICCFCGHSMDLHILGVCAVLDCDCGMEPDGDGQ